VWTEGYAKDNAFSCLGGDTWAWRLQPAEARMCWRSVGNCCAAAAQARDECTRNDGSKYARDRRTASEHQQPLHFSMNGVPLPFTVAARRSCGAPAVGSPGASAGPDSLCMCLANILRLHETDSSTGLDFTARAR
jgi:hypothetical protein